MHRGKDGLRTDGRTGGGGDKGVTCAQREGRTLGLTDGRRAEGTKWVVFRVADLRPKRLHRKIVML